MKEKLRNRGACGERMYDPMAIRFAPGAAGETPTRQPARCRRYERNFTVVCVVIAVVRGLV
jgi:hypothetical protein